MEIRLDPHQYEKRLKSMVSLIEKSEISERNKKLIFKFRDDCIKDGLSKPRIIKLLEILKSTALIFDKDFDKVKKRDIERFVTLIQQRDYSPWTKQSYKVILKKFFRWLKKTEEYPEEVKWIKTNINRNQLRLPVESELITEQEIKLLINNANNSRDKAFVSLLYESGCRIGELLTMKIKNVSFDQHGVLIIVNGKTGSRKIRVISSTQYLATWLENHPLKNDLENPLWINIGNRNFNKFMIYPAACKILKSLFKKCKINKNCNPHFFRHSRATFLANHLKEFQMNQYFGWVQGSNMPAVYVHMSGREIDSDLLALNGIQSEVDKKESILKPIKCPRCDYINGSDAKFCSKCAGILDIETAMKVEEKRLKESEMRKKSDEIMNKLMRDPEVQKVIMEKLAMMGLNK